MYTIMYVKSTNMVFNNHGISTSEGVPKNVNVRNVIISGAEQLTFSFQCFPYVRLRGMKKRFARALNT